MVNKIQHIITLLTSLALIACFSGCNGKREQKVENGQYRVLVVAPLTGTGSELGQSSRAGMEMAMSDLAKGKDGVNIELLFHDSKTDPKTALSIFSSRQMLKACKVVIGEMSGVSRALVAPAQRDSILLLATLVGVPNIGQGSPYFARVNVMSDAIAPPLAAFAAKKYKSITCLYLNDDYGRANYELFAKTFRDAGGQIKNADYFGTDPAEARTLVKKVSSSGEKAVFIAGYGQTYIALFKVFKELAPDIQVFADIGLVNDPVFQALGNAINGVYVAATDIDEYPPTQPAAIDFHNRYSQMTQGKRPDYVSAYSYDTVKILSDALRSVGSDDPVLIRNYLTTNTFTGFGGRFKGDKLTGDSIYEALPLFQIRNGQVVRLTEAELNAHG